MGRKQILREARVIDAVDITTDPISKPSIVEQLDFFSYEIAFDSSDIEGKCYVEINSDEELKATAEWRRLNFGTDLDIVFTNGGAFILVNDVHFKRARLAYENAAGTGTLTVAIKGGTKGA